MPTVEQVVDSVTPSLVDRRVREIVANRGADEASSIPVEIIADRIISDARVEKRAAQRISLIETLKPRIEQQVASIDGMRFIRND